MIPILLSAVVAASPINYLSTFRDWIVGCDNRHACHATTLYPELTAEEVEAGVEDSVADNAIGIAILRNAGANDAAHVRFLHCYQCDPKEDPDPAAVRSLAVLDKVGKVLFRLKLSLQDVGQANAPDGLPIPADSSLFAALAEGEVIELHDGSDQFLTSISLRGLRDAMRYMDTDQRRLGNVTALAERGKAAATLVPPWIPEPPIIVPPASALPPVELTPAELRRLQEKNKCDDPVVGLPEAIYQRLDDRTTMLLLNAGCSSYNGEGFVYVVDNGGKALLAPVRLTPTETALEAPQVVSAHWDKKERRLHSFERGRAMADCGAELTFAWDGTQFLLVEEADMGACRGSVDYITVYRRETVERGKLPR